MNSQPFICLKCVLWECDDTSPNCLYQLETKVVSRKAKIARTRAAIKKAKADLERMESVLGTLRTDRKTYDRQRYLLRKAECTTVG